MDRPFTYLLPEDAGAGVGTLVSVPFHGRTVKGWILGPAAEIPTGRLLPIRTVRSRVRFFDPLMLDLLRWVSFRYVAPLSVVIERSHPPRVVGVETEGDWAGAVDAPPPGARGVLEPSTVSWLRPLPGEEASECIRVVGECVASGRSAIVIVPVAEPLPFTAAAVLEQFGDHAVNFVGGEPRDRYRTWLDILSRRYEVVVGTRPSVFVPLRDLGLLWVSREVHPGHREERAPYYHVREVAMARARLHGAACVLASYSPSVETGVGVEAGEIRVRRPPRQVERARAPLIETTPPEGEDRSARLARLLKSVRSAALIVSRRGYGVARVCKACGQPAACAVCRGAIALERGVAVCVVCGAAGRCANCGAGIFGVERGGVERIVEWGARIAEAPVFGSSDRGPAIPGHGAVIVGTAASVNDVGPLELDLVAVLDPDRALARPGVHSGERAVSTWMEAAAWARPREQGGRVLAQTRRPGHPAIQALVRWDPDPFIRSEATARKESGFPAGHPVFRIEGTSRLEDELRETRPETLLATGAGDRTVCLVAVHPARLAGFRRRVVSLAGEGVVTRVEAEPQL